MILQPAHLPEGHPVWTRKRVFFRASRKSTENDGFSRCAYGKEKARTSRLWTGNGVRGNRFFSRKRDAATQPPREWTCTGFKSVCLCCCTFALTMRREFCVGRVWDFMNTNMRCYLISVLHRGYSLWLNNIFLITRKYHKSNLLTWFYYLVIWLKFKSYSVRFARN